MKSNKKEEREDIDAFTEITKIDKDISISNTLHKCLVAADLPLDNSYFKKLSSKTWSENYAADLNEAKRFLEEIGLNWHTFCLLYNEQVETKIKIKEDLVLTALSNSFDNLDIYGRVSRFHRANPFFFKDKVFWLWSEKEKLWDLVEETQLSVALSKFFQKQGVTTNSKVKSEYIESFKQIGIQNQPSEPPLNWIQFKDKIFDLKTKYIFDATPEYFFTNPIPWSIGETENTPTIDKLFLDWASGDQEVVQKLYEIIAYCCYRAMPIHRAFCLIGSGRNGKGQYLGIVEKFLGSKNCASSSLDLLADNRFETISIYRKLAVIMGETNQGTAKKTDIFKRITGGDSIRYEFKGGGTFNAKSYATPIIASNSLPTTLDTTDGFYSRWDIIEFKNRFKDGFDIIDTIPEEEFSALARKVTLLLPKILRNGAIIGTKSIEERRIAYEAASNPLPLFIEKFCERGDDKDIYHIKPNDLYVAYRDFILSIKGRVLRTREFYELLRAEGYDTREQHKLNGENFTGIYGIKLKDDWRDILKEGSKSSTGSCVSTLIPYIENKGINQSTSSTSATFSK